MIYIVDLYTPPHDLFWFRQTHLQSKNTCLEALLCVLKKDGIEKQEQLRMPLAHLLRGLRFACSGISQFAVLIAKRLHVCS